MPLSQSGQPPATPPPPTPQQGARIAQAGGAAIDPATQTPAQAQAASQAAIQQQAQTEGVTISDADAAMIAEHTIKALEARGAFEQPPAAPPADPTAGNAGPGATGLEPPASEEPRKRSFAEKFANRNKG